MGFGKLFPSMAERLEKHIRGQTVWDLGAGDMTLSRKLLQLGAVEVVAVDKERSLHPVPKGVRFLQDYFNAVQAPAQISVAFVSWPQNTHLSGLLELLQKSAVVVYLGEEHGRHQLRQPKDVRALPQQRSARIRSRPEKHADRLRGSDSV